MDVYARQWSRFPVGPTARLMERMVGPLVGVAERVGVFLRASRDPRFVTAGAELTGVHVLDGRPKPVGSYHIGGNGTSAEEAFIKTLSETTERYAQLTAVHELGGRIRYASYSELIAQKELVIDAASLRFYTDEQLTRPGFPFSPFRESDTIGWLQASSMRNGQLIWVPAQLFLVGYMTKSAEREPRLGVGVTTGTAGHIDRPRAVKNALLELCQLDSVMGHWHSAAVAPEIEMDARTDLVARFLARHWHQESSLAPTFYYLANPDLPGHAVACIVRNPNAVPRLGIGVGSDTRLDRAMHKALLEGIGVIQLAKLTLFQRIQSAGSGAEALFNREHFYDLDANVAYYALPENGATVNRKFGGGRRVKARDLPLDWPDDPVEFARLVVTRFEETGKELVCLDLTLGDIAEFGFKVARVWSPDTISLSLPSVPPLGHKRYDDYGGVEVLDPHPYP